MKTLLFFLLSISLFSVAAVEKNVAYTNYEDALKALDTISFDMESTKAGLITTGFTGVAKSFSLDYERVGNTFKNMTITILVASLDTDIDGRNEKMHELCFDYKNFDKIIVRLKNNFEIGDSLIQKASILVRGKWFDINLSIQSSIQGDKTLISGSSAVSLKALLIPDPSIWIASVRDLVDLKFKLEL
jgi:hypothetical protein